MGRVCWQDTWLFEESVLSILHSSSSLSSLSLFSLSRARAFSLSFFSLFHFFRVSEDNLAGLKCTDKERTFLASCFLSISLIRYPLPLPRTLSLQLFCPTASVLISHFLRSLSLVSIASKFSSLHLSNLTTVLRFSIKIFLPPNI